MSITSAFLQEENATVTSGGQEDGAIMREQYGVNAQMVSLSQVNNCCLLDTCRLIPHAQFLCISGKTLVWKSRCTAGWSGHRLLELINYSQKSAKTDHIWCRWAHSLVQSHRHIIYGHNKDDYDWRAVVWLGFGVNSKWVGDLFQRTTVPFPFLCQTLPLLPKTNCHFTLYYFFFFFCHSDNVIFFIDCSEPCPVICCLYFDMHPFVAIIVSLGSIWI